MSETTSTTKPKRFLSRAEVLARVPLSYVWIWKLMAEGKFPLSRQLGERRIAWVESEIEEWMDARPPRNAARRGVDR